MKKHVRFVHEGQRPFKCPFEGCKYSAKTRQYFRLHQRTHMAKDERPQFKCDECDKTFLAEDAFNHHKVTKHGVGKAHTCEICGKKFSKPIYLNHHMNWHNGLKPFACTHEGCDYHAWSPDQVQKHMRRHVPVNQRPYKCDHCDKRYTTPSQKATHIKLVHEGQLEQMRVQCNLCGEIYSSKNYLKYHMIRAHGEEKTLVCPHCPKKFVEPQSLQKHILIHSAPSIICEECGRAFRTELALKNHMRVHTGETPYHCQHCPYQAKTGITLRKHIKSKHK